MNGNPTNPYAALLSPFSRYLESRFITKPEQERRIAEAMRRAGLQQAAESRAQKRFAREEEDYTTRKAERERARAFAERVRGRVEGGGRLTPSEAFEASTYGYDIPKWMVEGQEPELPDWLARYEYQRQHGVGLFKPEAERDIESEVLRYWQAENSRRSMENRATRARAGMKGYQPPLSLEEARREYKLWRGMELEPHEMQYEDFDLPPLTGDLGLDVGMPGGGAYTPGPGFAGFPSDTGPSMAAGAMRVSPSALMMDTVRQRDPEAAEALEYLGLDETASPAELQAALQTLLTDPSLPDTPLKARTIQVLEDMIALSGGF